MTSEFARVRQLDRLTCAGGSHELRELPLPGGGVDRVVRGAPSTLVDVLAATESFAGLEYIRYRGEAYTFGDVLDQTSRLARALARLGVRRGDRVAVCMRNLPEWPAALFAPMALGAISVSLNGWWSAGEIADGLQDCGASVLIADRDRLARVEDDLAGLGVRAIGVRCPELRSGRVVPWGDALAASCSGPLPHPPVGPDDNCMMLYTSGSTGGPKGAVSTHRSVVHALMAWEIENRAQAALQGLPVVNEPFDAQQRMLVTIPFFHVTACHVCMLTGLRYGRRLTLMRKWDPSHAVDLIDRERITHFISVPTVTGDLVREAARLGRDLPSLLYVGGGGSHRPVSQVAAIAETFRNALPSTGWGMTETNAIGTQIAGSDYLRVPTSSGRRSVLMDLRIARPEDGAELPRGETGEVWVRGTPVVRRYWNKPGANRRAFRDGWFRTGDLAFRDDEGFVHFVDRIKDIVIRGGENISCLRVEDALHRCQGVAEAVALGIPDDRLGEQLAAVVVARPGADVSERSLRDALGESVARFEVPAHILVWPAPLPRIATGKFDKRRIRAFALAEIREQR
ncbi:MAG: class I adenylate-forming enzyme family protein [Bryobacterales bacterium]|nr:class I adenylate-forming enzyme family protein [Bryobacterales bacterium]